MKKIVGLLLISIILMPIITNAQINDSKVIIRNFENESGWNHERLMDSIILDDGSFIVVGGYESGARPEYGNVDAFLGIVMRYDKDGNLMWEKVPRNEDWNAINSIALLPDGDILVTGEEVSAKLDIDGNVKWVKDFGFYNMAIDKEGNIFTQDYDKYYKYSSDLELIKEVNIPSSYDYDAITLEDGNIAFLRQELIPKTSIFKTQVLTVEKVDNNLNTIWKYTLTPSPIGNYFDDYTLGSIEEINSDIYITGSTNNFELYDTPASNDSYGFIIALDKNGNKKWYQTYNNGYYFVNITVVLSPNNTLYVAGVKNHKDTPSSANSDAQSLFILEYSLDGTFIDQKELLYSHKVTRTSSNGGKVTFGGNVTPNYSFSNSKNGYVIVGYSPLKNINYNPLEDPNANTSQYGFILYNTWPTIFEIKKEIKGHGNITVSEQSIGEEKIRFKVNPNIGYELEKITILDKNDNQIEYKKIGKNEFEFLMPQSDIKIMTSFKKANIAEIVTNPKTAFHTLKIILSIILITYIGTFIYKHKKRVN